MIDKGLINTIGHSLILKGQTIAVAESVTAGNLQAALSMADDARLFFQGGITAYNLGQKARLLEVEPIHADSCDCVSGEVADQIGRPLGQNLFELLGYWLNRLRCSGT